MIYEIDRNAPFFTSGGKIALGSNPLNLGPYSRASTYWCAPMIHEELVGGWWPANFQFMTHFCTVRSGSAARNPIQCLMIGNYSIRQPTDFVHGPVVWGDAMKQDRYRGKAVVSDGLNFMFFHYQNTVMNNSSYGAGYYGWPWVQECGRQVVHTPAQLIQQAVNNHDRSYNVLFEDGSVKTFADPSNFVAHEAMFAGASCNYTDDLAGRAFVDRSTVSLGSPAATSNAVGTDSMNVVYGCGLEKTVWKVYFDPLYAQD